MPQVPVLEAPSIDLRPLPDVRVANVQPGNNAIQAGNAAMSTSNAVGNAAMRLQDQRNADRLFRAEAAIQEEYLTFETSLQDRRGQNAWGVTQDVDKWWGETGKKYMGELENDVQRRLFEGSVSKLRLRSLDSASKFEGAQRRVSMEESAKSSITTSINLAAASHDDPAALAGTKQDILKRVQVLSDLNGWTPERRQAEEAELLTNLHSQVIQAKIDADPEGAQKYFEANKAEINGTQRDAVSKIIEQGTIRAKAQSATDVIMAQGLPHSAALAEARKSFKGAEEDEVVQRLNARYAEREAAIQQAERKSADQAWDIFARTGTVSSLPTELLNRLDGRTLLTLKKEEAARVSGAEVKTDWDLYYQLKQQASAQPAEFAKLDLRQHFGQLSPTERRSMIELQEKINKPDSAYDVATLEQQLGRSHQLMGWGSKDNETRGQFDSAVYQALDAETKNIGRKLTFEERQKVIDRMLISGEVTSGHWYSRDKNQQFFQVSGTEDSANFVPDVPDAERKKIEGALRRAGMPVTDAAVARLYKQKSGL